MDPSEEPCEHMEPVKPRWNSSVNEDTSLGAKNALTFDLDEEEDEEDSSGSDDHKKSNSVAVFNET